ncbi:hypothetical protein FJQ87_10630 [Shewanella sp. SNU WT4]|nr:hypothetical protein FJQ87_10630 [Shewanella sp. SNU WT4]
MTELNKGKLTKKTFDAISSVSKIASFMQPDKYAVYDSRVIYSLNWLLFNYANSQSMFPQPVGRNLELVKYDMQTIFRLSGRNVEYISHKIAFQEYCALVKDLSVRVYGEGSKPYMVEMLLFMIAPTWIVSEIARSVTVSINLLK